ncbi:hypothetical protein ACFX2F_001610 [Malus domestica]
MVRYFLLAASGTENDRHEDLTVQLVQHWLKRLLEMMSCYMGTWADAPLFPPKHLGRWLILLQLELAMTILQHFLSHHYDQEKLDQHVVSHYTSGYHLPELLVPQHHLKGRLTHYLALEFQ